MGHGMVHPCFLYESIWCLTGFVVIHFLSKKRKFSGEVFLMYLAWYGFGRAIIETLRTDSLMIGPFKVSLLLGILLCIVSVTLIVIIRKKLKEKEAVYESVFSDEAEEAFEEDIAIEESEIEEVEDNVQAD